MVHSSYSQYLSQTDLGLIDSRNTNFENNTSIQKKFKI